MITSSLTDRIETYILKRTGTTLSQIESLATQRGFSLDEIYAALETIHRNKKIRRTVKAGDVVYSPAPEPRSPVDHTKWIREWYAKTDHSNFEMPWPEIDMSWMFLRTKEERDEYKAAASGRPIHMLKSRHGNPGR